jgi:hypothetical protein
MGRPGVARPAATAARLTRLPGRSPQARQDALFARNRAPVVIGARFFQAGDWLGGSCSSGP